MKFSITPEAFQGMLAQTVSAVPTRTTSPILQNVLLSADEQGVVVSATDLDVGLRIRVPAKVDEPGTLAVPAKKLLDLARTMPSETVQVQSDGLTCKITSGKARFSLHGLDGDEFPSFPELHFDGGHSVPASALASMVEKTAFAVSTEESRPVLNGVFWQLRADHMAMVATDGHRLARYVHQGESGFSEGQDLIVPGKVLQQVKKLFSGAEAVEVTATESHIGFRRDGTLIFARLVEGPYPNYDAVIPKDNDKKAIVDNALLQGVLRRMAVLASEQTHRVRLSFAGSSLRLSVETPDLGEGQDEIEVAYDAEPLELGFNANYLLDVLKAVPSETVEITMKTPERAALIRPSANGAGETPDYVALVMPLRLLS